MNKNFVYGESDTGDAPVILTMEPYRNVALLFDAIKVYEGGFMAKYIIVRNPTGRNLLSDPRFDKYVQDVVKQIWSEQHGNDNQKDDPADS